MEGSPSVGEGSRPVIFVTGFGPFAGHTVNASQLAVETLNADEIEKELGVKLVCEIVEVEYDYVKKTIPQRWKDMKPKLMVHVGVSSIAETLTLEQVAHNTGYERHDNTGSAPSTGVCQPGGRDVLQSSIRMDLVSCCLNKDTCLKLPCTKSTDPGRFLCDFIYYLSLHEDSSRSAFIHVPTVAVSPLEDITAALTAAIKSMYKQVLEMEAEAADTQKTNEVEKHGREAKIVETNGLETQGIGKKEIER